MADSKLIYAAIDLGTSFSGWAYSTKTDPEKIYVRKWYPHYSSIATQKTPTCALIRPDGSSLECFGYDAQRKFEELANDKCHENYYYFNDFKTKLYAKYNQPLETGMRLVDQLGRPLPAINVFSASIKYLADDMFTELQKSLLEIKRENIQWILTVPAIWTDKAKFLMREAAIKAGITTDSLIMALEPEAASVCCLRFDVRAVNAESDVTLSSLEVGSKYLVVDAGGGTIDLTTHEVASSKSIRQIVASGGNARGGNTINREFETFLAEAISSDKYDMFKQKHTEDWLYFMADFEGKKKYFDPEKQTKLTVKFPAALREVYISKKKKSLLTKLNISTSKKKSFEEAISETGFGKDVSVKGDKLIFSSDMFSRFFSTAIEGTIKEMKKQFRKLSESEVSCIFMVGGFSECILLQQSVKSAFPDLPILIPKDASVAVLKGAVLYGHNPPVVSERVVKYTYGVKASEPFNKDHPFEKATFTDSGLMCVDIFHKHVTRDQLVKTDEPQKTITYYPVDKRQTCVRFDICASKLLEPRYTTDKDCRIIGTVKVQLSQTNDARRNAILVFFAFGGTEIDVTAIEEKTGKQVKTNVSFLE
ncbi:heat shock 70 kDa protein 12A-like [Mercenaria mercenaria]|uniref:heat shock 70 kDa protein 12A-like n=1 Tax=Mercenaria mercenaria TaxID=6596 RepID=UPI00234E5CC6|nr:heat shock 70 kDa protein 12A-like [Mercenaria mercenaria]